MARLQRVEIARACVLSLACSACVPWTVRGGTGLYGGGGDAPLRRYGGSLTVGPTAETRHVDIGMYGGLVKGPLGDADATGEMGITAWRTLAGDVDEHSMAVAARVGGFAGWMCNDDDTNCGDTASASLGIAWRKHGDGHLFGFQLDGTVRYQDQEGIEGGTFFGIELSVLLGLTWRNGNEPCIWFCGVD